MEIATITQSEKLNAITAQIVESVDVSDTTRRDYAIRIKHFFRFIEQVKYLNPCKSTLFCHIGTKTKSCKYLICRTLLHFAIFLC